MTARVAGVGDAFPGSYHPQQDLLDSLRESWGTAVDVGKLAQLFRNSRVEGRHIALPLEEYRRPRTLGENMQAWMHFGTEIGERAVGQALAAAGLVPADVDTILFVSVTGLATPSMDVRLANRLGFRPQVRRIPIFGLGCVAGAAGLALGAEIAARRPQSVVLVLSVELCSLTFRLDDRSGANMVAAGLFGDGAAAVVLVGAERAAGGPEIVATRSILYPDTEDAMGWDLSQDGFRLILSPRVPALVARHIGGNVDGFLRDHGLGRDDIGTWISHPGGPRVLAAIQEALDLPAGALGMSWDRLRAVGNLSSASVLHTLKQTLNGARPPGDSLGLLMAFGPGFCAELVLLRWPSATGRGAP
jgi:alkylresorcinol/alkylpyrone synthase